MILELGRQSLEYSRRMNFIQRRSWCLDVGRVLRRHPSEEVEAKIEAMEARLRQQRLGFATTQAIEPAVSLTFGRYARDLRVYS
jgi:hypothetical protein